MIDHRAAARPARKLAVVIAGVLAIAGLDSMQSTAVAQNETAARSCAANKSFVPGFGCVRKSEIAQAIRNCKAISEAMSKKVPYTECLCQDGNSVGACGD
jgi:hypothetical protein